MSATLAASGGGPVFHNQWKSHRRFRVTDSQEKPVTFAEAAEAVGVAQGTLAKWARSPDGPPVERQGEKGPGNGGRIFLSKLRGWLAGRSSVENDNADRISLDDLAEILYETYRRDSRSGNPVHVEAGVAPLGALLLLAEVYERAYLKLRSVWRDNSDELPGPMRSIDAEIEWRLVQHLVRQNESDGAYLKYWNEG